MKQPFSRITVKVGSNVLTRPDGTLDVTRMSALADQIAELHRSGIEVILVSSGAVASGRSEIRPCQRLDSVEQRQLFSAIGQVKLINRYYELFREHGISVGQILTTKESFSTRRHYLNQKNCMEVMLKNNVIPIVNENDTISVTELMFTDNDELSGLIAAMMDAQALILLSNIDGIYNGSPSDPSSSLITEIGREEDLTSYIQTSRSSFGRGGMLTKTNIAHKVADEGITVIIANGKRENILTQIIKSESAQASCPYTRFIPAPVPASGIKKWIAHSEGFAKGKLHVNSRVADMLLSDKAENIPSGGITGTEGDFEKDDLVQIIAPDGKQIGVGKVNCSALRTKEHMNLHDEYPIVYYDYLYVE